jgi:hypothetical protein
VDGSFAVISPSAPAAAIVRYQSITICPQYDTPINDAMWPKIDTPRAQQKINLERSD